MMKDNILATLAYYDVIDFPLKAEEIFEYLANTGEQVPEGEINLEKIKRTLDHLVLDSVIDIESKFYFLKGRDYLVPLRRKRKNISEVKLNRAKRAISWLRFIPYVEAVFASGSLALGNCDELSDLDVLVVVRHGRIWLTRILISGTFSLLRIRRKYYEKTAPNKICLNHYITDKSLKIPFESIYNAQTYVNLKPILLNNRTMLDQFRKENNWISKFIIGPWQINNDHKKIIQPGWLSNVVAGIFRFILDSVLGDWLEGEARQYQIKRIEKNPQTKSVGPTRGHVVYSDKQLSFHPDSPEIKIIENYNLKLTSLKTLD